MFTPQHLWISTNVYVYLSTCMIWFNLDEEKNKLQLVSYQIKLKLTFKEGLHSKLQSTLKG